MGKAYSTSSKPAVRLCVSYYADCFGVDKARLSQDRKHAFGLVGDERGYVDRLRPKEKNCRTLVHVHARTCMRGALRDMRAASCELAPSRTHEGEGGGFRIFNTNDVFTHLPSFALSLHPFAMLSAVARRAATPRASHVVAAAMRARMLPATRLYSSNQVEDEVEKALQWKMERAKRELGILVEAFKRYDGDRAGALNKVLGNSCCPMPACLINSVHCLECVVPSEKKQLSRDSHSIGGSVLHAECGSPSRFGQQFARLVSQVLGLTD